MSKARRAKHSGQGDSGVSAPVSEGPRRSPVPLRLMMAGAVVLAVAGTTAVGLMTRGHTRHDDTTAQATAGSRSTRSASASTSARARGPVMAKSTPVSLRIRRLGVRSALVPLGLRSDGTIGLPPVTHVSTAGWYENSPTPGQMGPSILLGYAAAPQGERPAFGRLGRLHRGDVIQVNRADGTAAVFRVYRVGRYPVTRFPTDEVYSKTDYAALRLITVTLPGSTPGPTDRNIVVYANLVKRAAAS